MNRPARSLLSLALLALAACAGATGLALPFSGLAPGTPPEKWIHTTLPKVAKASVFDLVDDGGSTVLRIRSDAAASSLTQALSVDPGATPLLKWRWKVSSPVKGSDLGSKHGDDYAARLYVFFDLPAERLSLADRLAIAAARMVHGAELPTAALCYVWGTAQAIGTIAPNPYTDRVRMIVLRSGEQGAGRWQSEARDLQADFRAAFGEPAPRVSGVSLSADTDNTGERVEARFGDILFEPSR